VKHLGGNWNEYSANLNGCMEEMFHNIERGIVSGEVSITRYN
jgi:hypothetical protein